MMNEICQGEYTGAGYLVVGGVLGFVGVCTAVVATGVVASPMIATYLALGGGLGGVFGGGALHAKIESIRERRRGKHSGSREDNAVR